MNKHYGLAIIEELNELRMSLIKVSDEELRQMLEQYRAMV
jgi:hypothetical protein